MGASSFLRQTRASLALFRSFILRGFWREKLRACVTVLGVCLGVAVFVSIRLSNDTSLQAFRTATESIAGRSSVEVVGVAGRFDELLLRDALWLREYGHLSPVIDGYVQYMGHRGAASDGPPEILRALGVDILRDQEIRTYRLLRLHKEGEEPSGREFLDLLREPNAVILTEKFARRRGIDIGDPLIFVVYDRQLELTVRGLLTDDGPARTAAGHFALLDIAVAQVLFDRLGQVDRLDVRLHDGLSLDAARAAIAPRLPPELRLNSPRDRYRQVEKMIAAFHFNLNALGSLALLVGLFLVYNAISTAVLRRRAEIGLLRTAGTGRRTVLLLFLGEALLLAVVGCAIGLPLGKLLSWGAVEMTAATVETFYLAREATAHAAQRELTALDAALALAVAMPFSLIAAYFPAREGSHTSPLEVTRRLIEVRAMTRPPTRLFALSLAFLVCGYALCHLPSWNGQPVWGYLASVCILFGAATLVPMVLWVACRALRGAGSGDRSRPLATELAGANLHGAVSRVAVSVGALAVSLAMVIAISIMIGSFRETVVYWTNQTLQADLFIKPVTLTSGVGDDRLSPQTIDIVESDDEVLAVDRFVSREVQYAGQRISLGAGDFEVVYTHGQLSFKAPANAHQQLKAAIGKDAVMVSESFSLRYDKQPGDSLLLPTPTGNREFFVAAIFYDYSDTRGRVVMDRRTYARLYATPEGRGKAVSLSVYLQADADPTIVKERLLRALGPQRHVVISTQRDIRQEVMRIFDSTFVITYALQVVAVVIAALGIVSTLSTLLLDRRREICLLTAIGATTRQLRSMLMVESHALGMTSLFVGIPIGTLLSLVLIYVINVQSFAWTIQYHFPWRSLLQMVVGIALASTVAGLAPGNRIRRWKPAEVLREE